MLRSLIIIGFQRTLKLQAQTFLKFPSNPSYLLTGQQCLKFYRTANVNVANSISARNEPLFSDIGGDYIVAYDPKDEHQSSRKLLIKTLNSYYNLSEADINRISNDESLKRNYKERFLLFNLRLLHGEGVKKRSFVDYPWMITLNKRGLLEKLNLIKTMHIRDINDFVAYLRLTLPRLRSMVESMNREAAIIPNTNRVYYISEKLGIDPYVVSKYLSNRLFILQLPFSHLERNLQNMIDYNVSPMNILRDLWAFRYRPTAVAKRLERARDAKKDKIMPWMVRCPETILERSLKLTLDELEVLDGKNSVIEYVAERLEFDVDETKAIMMKHPQVFRVRVTKIKEVLDYLLGEAGFTRYDIAQVPRVLCHSLETTKQRLEQLQSYGCRPSTLVILCRSKREYEKFLNSWTKEPNNEQSTTVSKTEDL